MERRKFVIGVGSLAAGGAAAMGTGAFTSATVDRTVSVDVDPDADAYLGLAPADTNNGAAYARVAESGDSNEDQVEVDFNGIQNNNGTNQIPNSSDTGTGVNADALFRFDNVIEVTNQGSQEVTISNPDGEDEVVDGGKPDLSDNEVAAYVSGPNSIGVGESTYIGFWVKTGDDTTENISGDVVIEADATGGS